MLSSVDEEIITRDSALPGLRFVLDGGALGARFALPPMTPVYLRYKPGTSCMAAFLPEDGGFGVMAVWAVPPARLQELAARPEWFDGPDPAILDRNACLVLVPLARDRKIKGARLLADPECGAAFLHKLAGQGARPQILRYKPGRRLVLRSGDVLVKAYSKTDFAAALEGARIAERLGGAAIRTVSERHRCIVWDWLGGVPLCPQEGGHRDLAAWRNAGLALARIHASSARPGRQITRADEAAENAAVVPDLRALSPELARLAAPLADMIAVHLAKVPVQPRLIHGDFSADQVLIDGARVAVIDWDRAATGDRARDIGSALARLDAQWIDGAISLVERDDFAEALRQGYCGPAKADNIALQHARALLALGSEGFRQRCPHWPERAEALIARATEVLSAIATDPALPALDVALDGQVMAPRVANALGQADRAVAVDLVRHKPGRRALIRYRLGDARVLGKLRAKGPDCKTPALHQALRAAGLDGRAPLNVGVPAARGAIAAPALWFQDEVAGGLLADMLHPGGDIGPVARTGTALARLHLAGVPATRVWTMADEVGVLERALATARAHLPDEATRIEGIAVAAAGLVQRLGPVEATGIHRDFYPDQVLIDGGRVWLLDLDLYAEGDPVIDLANFLAHLDEFGLRQYRDLTALGRHAAAFLAGYAAARPIGDQHRLEVLRLVSLARHINLSRIIAGRAHTTKPLIDHCAALCQGYQPPPSILRKI
ncbi:aminoglycoside phosphotransferase family protein [Pseudorhodobacter aquimaris]|uniref:aminoglycoside phosphotransferase family protein n=1 Tax=Pseudorhodobacter aquimaris TaxID=687412 RepID=UPI00067CC102|nr:aminoglycoside phosphotransferase family protein [Pseudorhodobacter aquimaris]